jgi:CRP-like cAMP-binding protein
MLTLDGLRFTEKKVRFKSGEIIFNKQEQGTQMYFIDSGRVKMVMNVGENEIILATLDQGDFFGEMALITGNKRIATAIALTDCKLNTMDKKTFEENLLNDKRFMMKVVESQATRLEETGLNLKRHLQRFFRMTKVFNITG